MSIVLKVIAMIAASLITIVDIVILIICRKKEYEKTGMKVFLMEDLFVIGDTISRLIKLPQREQRTRKLSEIYDVKTAGNIARSARLAPVTYIFLFTPILLISVALTGNKLIGILMLTLIGFLAVYFDMWLTGILKKRHDAILRDFATVLSKMSLMVNVGVTGIDAFCKVAKSSEGVLYQEMQRAADEIENGMSIDRAMEGLASRSGCKEVRKFVALYKQNLLKGGPEFPILLQNMADTAWQERKTRARLAGTNAEQKLLAPIMLMFIGVLIMVIVPAFNNLL